VTRQLSKSIDFAKIIFVTFIPGGEQRVDKMVARLEPVDDEIFPVGEPSDGDMKTTRGPQVNVLR
jgi:hypothetical protein